jgi:hypothetical protein
VSAAEPPEFGAADSTDRLERVADIVPTVDARDDHRCCLDS